MANNLKTIDGQQVLRSIYDPAGNRIRVDAQISAQIGQVEVILDQTADTIAIGDGTTLFTGTTVGADHGLDVNIITPNLDIRDLSYLQDTITNTQKYEDFSSTLSQTLNSSYTYINTIGYSHIGCRVVPPTGGIITFEGTFDGTNWFSILFRSLESSIFTSSVSTTQDVIGSIIGLKSIRFRTSTAGTADGSVNGRVQSQLSIIEGIEHINDESIAKIISEVKNSQITYIGKSFNTAALTSNASWQIQRQLTQSNTVTTEYANNGQYDQIWDDRESLFPTPVLSNPASLLFDGVDEYINVGDNYTFGPATAFSWSFWFKANNFASQRCFIAKTAQDANVYGYSFQHTSAGKLYAQVRASGTLRAHTYPTVMTAGTWYHICFTYAGGSNMNGLKAYINGAVESAPSSQSLNAWTVTDPLTIAARGTGFHFSGNMNQISVWNKELSAAEVSELYNSGSPADLNSHSASANLLSWWKLNTNSSFPTEVDNKASINGTLINMEITDYINGDVP